MYRSAKGSRFSRDEPLFGANEGDGVVGMNSVRKRLASISTKSGRNIH
ncbi:hypothetical protein [Vibrio vulnificus YJ016]|uniref:Uncharacterized protein n=1 Tax=Vibrio vulnificus (strain YJ016) TaxID=196600 RepID=Q7MD53_VIBVY|nr:hypothetical protein [Vibrio vulnificus YJ016]